MRQKTRNVRKAIDLRNEADSMVFQTEKALSEVGDKIEAADKEKVEADLTHLKDLLEKTNPEVMSDSEIDDIKAAKEKLMEMLRHYLQSFMSRIILGGKGPDMSGADGSDPSQTYGDVMLLMEIIRKYKQESKSNLTI